MKKEGFSKIILVCLASVPKYNYSLWLENDLIDFLTMVINLIKNNQKYLFILKEKKGELSILSDKDFPQELKNNNCYLIRSNSPRELEHNQFEDLLQSSDLVISQAFTSTTIWQAIHNNIPAVGYNVKHPKSFQHEFKYFIINDNNAQNVMDYWLDIKNDEWKHFKNEINKTVNIGNGNGLAKVAEDIVKSFV